MALIVNRPLIWRLFDDSDEEDQNDFVIKEIRCCNCFFDLILSLISGKKKLHLIFYTINFQFQKLLAMVVIFSCITRQLAFFAVKGVR